MLRRIPIFHGRVQHAHKDQLWVKVYESTLSSSPPVTRLYITALCPFAAVGDWEQAKDLLEKMRLRGCKPDGGSFAALIAALHAGGQWQHALQTLDRMQVRRVLTSDSQAEALSVPASTGHRVTGPALCIVPWSMSDGTVMLRNIYLTERIDP